MEQDKHTPGTWHKRGLLICRAGSDGKLYAEATAETEDGAVDMVRSLNAAKGAFLALKGAVRDFENIRRNLNNDDNQAREDKCIASMAMIATVLDGAA